MRLDRVVVFERLTAGAENGFGEASETWTKLCREWAQRRDVSDQERLQAGREYSARIARFVIRFNAATETLTGDDRMQHEGDVWNILGVKEMQRRKWLEVTAERISD